MSLILKKHLLTNLLLLSSFVPMLTHPQQFCLSDWLGRAKELNYNDNASKTVCGNCTSSNSATMSTNYFPKGKAKGRHGRYKCPGQLMAVLGMSLAFQCFPWTASQVPGEQGSGLHGPRLSTMHTAF